MQPMQPCCRWICLVNEKILINPLMIPQEMELSRSMCCSPTFSRPWPGAKPCTSARQHLQAHHCHFHHGLFFSCNQINKGRAHTHDYHLEGRLHPCSVHWCSHFPSARALSFKKQIWDKLSICWSISAHLRIYLILCWYISVYLRTCQDISGYILSFVGICQYTFGYVSMRFVIIPGPWISAWLSMPPGSRWARWAVWKVLILHPAGPPESRALEAVAWHTRSSTHKFILSSVLSPVPSLHPS